MLFYFVFYLEWKQARLDLRRYKAELSKRDALTHLRKQQAKIENEDIDSEDEDDLDDTKNEGRTQADIYCEFSVNVFVMKYTNLCSLIQVMLVIPPNTACCE